MTEVSFYHLTTRPLEWALPRLLEKVVATGKRAVVMAGSEERVEALNAQLWTYDPASFLPHGSVRDGTPEEQPIWLTRAEENPNGASILVLTDGVASPGIGGFERCLDLFDGNDAGQLAAARERWAVAKAAGHAVTYWRQTAAGGWEKG
ncbi:MAG: DNA polymerase III subunit chi [Proteobacteria bacterium]|nr:DNA polymerase III subunit chi [Pseudomonadota bacterium]MBI3495809.1 DNA polymerase III subunit chi [Pseudomonadota bacterium]